MLNKICKFYSIILFLFMTLHTEAQDLKAPIAKKIPKELEKHGDKRIDNYYWLNDPENPEVIKYLEEENKYTETQMQGTKEFRTKLFEEIKGRIKQTDQSVPYKSNGYWYYTRFEEGQEYPVYCRKKETLDAAEEIMLNINEMAKGHNFYAASIAGLSDNNSILAFLVDTVGRRQYTLFFKDLSTGKILEDKISNVTSFTFSADNKTFFYGTQDLTTLRSDKVYRTSLRSKAKAELIFNETDETFNTSVYRTKSKSFVLIASGSTLTSEYQYLDASKPFDKFKVFSARERGHEYSIDHFEDKFYIVSNWDAQNFRLLSTSVTDTKKENWKEVVAHRPDVLLEGIEIFKDNLVLSERKNGLPALKIKKWKTAEEYYLDFGEATYDAYLSVNEDFDTKILRYGYNSMTTPSSTFDFDMDTKQKTLLKQQEVLGGFKSSDYQVERLYATAKDGTKVPISLVYKKGLKKEGNNPTLLYAYGSYGISMDATFSSARLSLLDRGFVYAIAHIRGGQEMGRQWYEDGKMFKKKNTFTDFVDCAEFLIAEKFTNKDKLFAQGGSAGGLLMGAVANLRPDLFRGIIAAVPFVDVVTTMLDETIPLTTGEYDEWGNPNNKDSYEYMLSYSPYDQVEKKSYPNLLVTTGLHDSQVQYFEPAKWVAKLREMKTDSNLLLLKTDMEAGHGGKTGRFKAFEDVAFVYAFMFKLLDIQK